MYRATDTTRGRQVAIKILPDTFASDPNVWRGSRDAKTLASLNHPRIAAIYGFEKRPRWQARRRGDPRGAAQAPQQEQVIVMLLNVADELRRRVPLSRGLSPLHAVFSH